MFFNWLSRISLWAAADPTVAEGEPPGGGGMEQLIMTLVMIVGLVAVFYFLMIRPESKRKKAAAQMRRDLIVGDTITTIGGITGRVISIKDDTLTLETGPDRSKIVIMRWAISSKGEQISDK